MKAFLIYESRVFPLDQDVTRLGRDLDNTFVFADKTISRFHAEVVKRDETFYLRDMRSTSGTYLNGQLLSGEAILDSGSIISLGELSLTFYTNITRLDATTKQRTGSLVRVEK